MLIGFNDVEAARVNGVKKLMNLDSKCIYPKMTRFNLEIMSILVRNFVSEKSHISIMLR